MHPTWNNHTIADDKHSDELDRLLSHHIGQGAEPEAAKDAVYKEYKRRQHLAGAAYHVKAAAKMLRDGYHKEAEKHNAMYRVHLQALGHKHSNKVPAEVLAIVPTSEHEHQGFFQNHVSDRLVSK